MPVKFTTALVPLDQNIFLEISVLSKSSVLFVCANAVLFCGSNVNPLTFISLAPIVQVVLLTTASLTLVVLLFKGLVPSLGDIR